MITLNTKTASTFSVDDSNYATLFFTVDTIECCKSHRFMLTESTRGFCIHDYTRYSSVDHEGYPAK